MKDKWSCSLNAPGKVQLQLDFMDVYSDKHLYPLGHRPSEHTTGHSLRRSTLSGRTLSCLLFCLSENAAQPAELRIIRGGTSYMICCGSISQARGLSNYWAILNPGVYRST